MISLACNYSAVGHELNACPPHLGQKCAAVRKSGLDEEEGSSRLHGKRLRLDAMQLETIEAINAKTRSDAWLNRL
jgi:hypothetical protein